MSLNVKVRIKTTGEIQKIRESCRITRLILNDLYSMAQIGITTNQLDQRARDLLKYFNAEPAFLNFGDPPYPAVICASINDTVVHGIPNDRELQDGDVLSIDFGAKKDGYFGDSAITVCIGDVDNEKDSLCEAVRTALYAGIKQAKVGNRVGDISSAIQKTIESMGYNVIKQGYGGHGIGVELHESPVIHNYGSPNTGMILKAGMVLAIEPMAAIGNGKVYVDNDQWTLKTIDGGCTAHYEHTIVITEDGAEILTNG